MQEVNEVIRKASESPNLAGVLSINELPLVSSDFNHNPHSSIFDINQTRVSGRLVKVMSWYDNEWGFSQRMLDTTLAWHKKHNRNSTLSSVDRLKSKVVNQ